MVLSFFMILVHIGPQLTLKQYWLKKANCPRSLTNSSLPTCPLREEKSFSQRFFSIYTDIRKLQDKAKTSYTLITEEVEVLI